MSATLPFFPDILQALLQRRELTAEQVHDMMEELVSGRCPEAEAAAFLIGLGRKGETVGEIAAAAAVLREHMVRWDPGRQGVLDTCGTGGDRSGTFNISTAAAFVAAAAGVPVVKHGNRAVSSRCGGADVLAVLGVNIDGDAAWARHCLEQAGLAFCFAPQFHPALGHVAAIRRRLGVPTLFNCLGPLANPAGASHQLLGVGQEKLLDLMAGALARLGTKHALVVCGRDGLDEVSLSVPTLVREVVGSRIQSWEWTSADLGLDPCALHELQADNAEASATIIREVLAGKEGPAARMVVANAAAALLAAEHVDTLSQGVRRAREALASGRARQVLERLCAVSRVA